MCIYIYIYIRYIHILLIWPAPTNIYIYIIIQFYTYTYIHTYILCIQQVVIQPRQDREKASEIPLCKYLYNVNVKTHINMSEFLNKKDTQDTPQMLGVVLYTINSKNNRNHRLMFSCLNQLRKLPLLCHTVDGRNPAPVDR